MSQIDPSEPQSTARSPRLRMLANGQEIKGATKAEVVSNNHYAADRFSGDVSLSADPAFGFQWWDAQTDIAVDIQIATSASADDAEPGWQSIIVGVIDHLQFYLTTQVVRFDGRDLTARFIEAKTQETFPNQTSSQIAETLAERHGMKASVKATKTLVGSYYEREHDRITMDNLSHQTTEWDLLTYLAQEEDFDVWVKSDTLYFQPQDANTDPPFKIAYTTGSQDAESPTLNVQSVTFERSLTLAKDIQVTVKSTNLRNGTAYIRTVKAQGAKSPGSTKSNTQNYVFTKPGLTPDQALKYAQQKLAELSKHERIMNVEMPGELELTPRNLVSLEGTNSGFDMPKWFIDEITRSISFDEGYTQHIRCKNASPKTQTTVL